MSIQFAKHSTYKPGKDHEKHLREIDKDLDRIFTAISPASGTGGAGGLPGGSNEMVQWNNNGLFGADAGFTYQTLASVSIQKDMKIIFDSNESSDTYLRYVSSTDYWELYVDGSVRIQA